MSLHPAGCTTPTPPYSLQSPFMPTLCSWPPWEQSKEGAIWSTCKYPDLSKKKVSDGSHCRPPRHPTFTTCTKMCLRRLCGFETTGVASLPGDPITQGQVLFKFQGAQNQLRNLYKCGFLDLRHSKLGETREATFYQLFQVPADTQACSHWPTTVSGGRTGPGSCRTRAEPCPQPQAWPLPAAAP